MAQPLLLQMERSSWCCISGPNPCDGNSGKQAVPAGGTSPGDIPGENAWQKRLIHTVPAQLRGNQQMYSPTVLALGPYNHGKPEFQKTEDLKDEVLQWYVSGLVSENKTSLLGKMMDRIKDIRSNYERIKHNDEALSGIILRDACFIIHYVVMTLKNHERISDRLGKWVDVFMKRDFCLLENQIPYWVIKYLVDLKFGEVEANAMVCKLLSFITYGQDGNLTVLPWKDNKEDEPVHLLEAYRAVLVGLEEKENDLIRRSRIVSCMQKFQKRGSNMFEMVDLPFHSVTYLQAKGIRFRPSSHSLRDIKFTSCFCYGLLQLPILLLSNTTKVSHSNIVAFEMSPRGEKTGVVVTAYVNFMKSLIETPEDVKLLREKGILYSKLGNNEEVVKTFKEIDTYGVDNYFVFTDVKRRIQKHCDSKAMTWVAELHHRHFGSPWTAIAVFAAAILLCLTFLQTFYTILSYHDGQNKADT